jgi:exonuclease SbcD
VRLIHTSDWHLGRSFHQVGLLGAQAAYLDHLVEVCRSERVDAVLVSGDVYDRAMPAPDTVALLSEAVERVIDTGARVVLASGNHDSAIRLGFASGLLERAGLHIRTSLAGVGRAVVVGDVAVYPLPYLEPALAADALGSSERSHAGVLRAAMAAVRADLSLSPARRSVVMAHAFVTGGATSDSERDISAGGVAAVPPEVFDGADYVALGHLHGRQQVSATARYSGSPVAMSFSEADHRKGSWLVDLSGRAPAVEFVDAPVERPVAVLRGDLDDLLADPRHTAAEGAWCHVTLTDPVRPVGAMDRVRRRFPHALELSFDPERAAVPVRAYAARLARRADVDVCCDFLDHVRGGRAATDEERALLTTALEASRVGRGCDDDEGLVRGARTVPDGGAAAGAA